MSWFWGRSPAAGAGSSSGGAGQGKPGDNDPPKSKVQVPLPEGGNKWVEFDPTGLERAAKAVKELNNSANAKEALALAKQQENTNQLKHQEEIKKQELAIQQYEAERIRVQHEERRKTLSAETKEHQERAQYQDQLARRRYDDQLSQQRKTQEETARRQEESVQRQEDMRRKTVEYEAELKHRNKMKKVEAEMRGQARVERENHDLRLEQIKLKAEERRKTQLQNVKTVGTLIGDYVTNFVTDWDKVYATAAGLTMVAFGIYAAKMGTGIAGRFLEARLGTPSLIKETSRLSFFKSIRHPISAIKRVFARPSDPLAGIVFEPKFGEKMRSLAKSTINTRRNGGLYQNVLMYGPPGTGKTMFAKSLAIHSGMDYAVLTGGDIVPLGKQGVTAMHKVFDWANASRKGVVLFMDEADAFLRKRSERTVWLMKRAIPPHGSTISTSHLDRTLRTPIRDSMGDQVSISEDSRSTLNAFLYRTGESSKRFMLVLASNQPDQFDWAINDRLDSMIEYDLPGEAERLRMLKLYFSLYISHPPRTVWWKKPKSVPLQSDINWEERMEAVSQEITGFSGREISKLAIAWQAAAFGSHDGVLTADMLDDCVDQAIKQNRQKMKWEEGTQR